MDAVRRLSPDVALIDIRMSPTFTHEGAAAAIELCRDLPGLGMLLLSQAVETHYAPQLLEEHAEHFGDLLKDRVLDVLALMAEGRSNSAIAERLTVTLTTVESHIANIFSKLGLPGAQDDHRRVLAVLAALTGTQPG